jgi:hypothetical protein
MTYTIVPNSGQSLGVTRVPINTNFSLIKSVFDQNHVDFNAAGAGKHLKIQMPTVQAASPGTAAGEIALYTKTVAGNPELFWQPQSIAAAGADIRMTITSPLPATFTPAFSPAVAAGNIAIVTFLPNGYLQIAGYVAGAGGASSAQTITFPFNITAFTSVNVTKFSTSGPTSRAFFEVTAVAAAPASITITSRDDGGSAANGFKYYYNCTAIL